MFGGSATSNSGPRFQGFSSFKMWLGEDFPRALRDTHPDHLRTEWLESGSTAHKIVAVKVSMAVSAAKISGLFQFVSVVFPRPLKFLNSLSKGWNWCGLWLWNWLVVGAPAGRWPRVFGGRREMKTPGKSKWTREEVFWRRLRCGIVCQVLEGNTCSWILTKRREDRIDYSSHSLQCLLSDTGWRTIPNFLGWRRPLWRLM